MAIIIKTRSGNFYGLMVRIEPGSSLTETDVESINRTVVHGDNSIQQLVIDSGSYDPVTAKHSSKSGPVDISLLSRVTLPIVRLVIGGESIYEIPDLSNFTSLAFLTIMNTSISELHPSVYSYELIELSLQDNKNLRSIDAGEFAAMTALKKLELVGNSISDISFLEPQPVYDDEPTVADTLDSLVLDDMEIDQSMNFLATTIAKWYVVLEYLSISGSNLIVTDEDIELLAANGSLQTIKVSPEQIDYDDEYAYDAYRIDTLIDLDDDAYY